MRFCRIVSTEVECLDSVLETLGSHSGLWIWEGKAFDITEQTQGRKHTVRTFREIIPSWVLLARLLEKCGSILQSSVAQSDLGKSVCVLRVRTAQGQSHEDVGFVAQTA